MEFLKAHVDYIILGILGLMSLIMLWKVVERYIFFARMDVRDYPNIHELNIALERNLTPIYTIGSNAPYVGLLGTVTGRPRGPPGIHFWLDAQFPSTQSTVRAIVIRDSRV